MWQMILLNCWLCHLPHFFCVSASCSLCRLVKVSPRAACRGSLTSVPTATPWPQWIGPLASTRPSAWPVPGMGISRWPHFCPSETGTVQVPFGVVSWDFSRTEAQGFAVCSVTMEPPDESGMEMWHPVGFEPVTEGLLMIEEKLRPSVLQCF